MRTLALVLVASTLGACGANECRSYIKAQNQCSRELSDAGAASPIESLSYDLVCGAFALPGVTVDEATREGWACLRDAYNDADCSSQEAFDETFDAECDADDTDTDTDA